MSKPLIETVKKMVIAKTPLIYIESEEEERVETFVNMLAETTFSKPEMPIHGHAQRGLN